MSPISKSDLYDMVANRPTSWFGVADTLLKAASLIWAERHFIPHSVWVALMLRGYALENLLKGLWVQSGNALAVDGRFKGIPGASDHDLVQVCKALGMPCPNERAVVLHALSNAMSHLGRYPIPLNHRQMAVHTETRPVERSMWCPEYEARFWAIVTDWASQFEFERKLPPGSLQQMIADTWRRPCRSKGDEGPRMEGTAAP